MKTLIKKIFNTKFFWYSLALFVLLIVIGVLIPWRDTKIIDNGWYLGLAIVPSMLWFVGQFISIFTKNK